MERAARIADLERQRDEARRELEEATIKLAGVEAQLSAARRMVEAPTELSQLPRTEAIVAVLRSASAPMNRSEVRRAMEAAGRSDEDDKTVGATLSYLRKRGDVQRIGRGTYVAV